MIIGIPKEVKDNEKRVSLTPYGVSELKKRNQLPSSSLISLTLFMAEIE